MECDEGSGIGIKKSLDFGRIVIQMALKPDRYGVLWS